MWSNLYSGRDLGCSQIFFFSGRDLRRGQIFIVAVIWGRIQIFIVGVVKFV